MPSTDLYIPGERYVWVELRERGSEDLPNIRIKLRTSILAAEWENIQPVYTDKELATEIAHDLIAPFVLDWNAAERDQKSGKVVAIPAPAEGGGAMFDKVPGALFVRIALKLQRLVLEDVDPKSSPPPSDTDAP